MKHKKVKRERFCEIKTCRFCTNPFIKKQQQLLIIISFLSLNIFPPLHNVIKEFTKVSIVAAETVVEFFLDDLEMEVLPKMFTEDHWLKHGTPIGIVVATAKDYFQDIKMVCLHSSILRLRGKKNELEFVDGVFFKKKEKKLYFEFNLL